MSQNEILEYAVDLARSYGCSVRKAQALIYHAISKARNRLGMITMVETRLKWLMDG